MINERPFELILLLGAPLNQAKGDEGTTGGLVLLVLDSIDPNRIVKETKNRFHLQHQNQTDEEIRKALREKKFNGKYTLGGNPR